jgi:quaternary ammonium compound-resistance protein SugE
LLPVLNPWLWLAFAGLAEVFWVVFLKLSDGFSRLIPSAAVVATLGISFFCMSQSLRALPMGTVYAVWTGIGAAGGLLWGIGMEGESADALRIFCVCLIVAGVLGLKLSS